MTIDLWARARVVLTAAVTYITILQAALVIFADEIGQLFADGQAALVVNIIVRAGAVLTAVVSIIRRVTPVLPSARGLLPTTSPPARNANDRGDISVTDVLLILLVVGVAACVIKLY